MNIPQPEISKLDFNYPHFKDEPFESLLVDETGETFVHQNWQYGLTGKVLETQFGENTFGVQYGLVDLDGNPTEKGKIFLQWGSWFISGNNLAAQLDDSGAHTISKSLQQFDVFLQNATEINSQELSFDIFTLARNIAFLHSLERNIVLSDTDISLIKEKDLTTIPISKSFNIVEPQPGFWGKSRSKNKIDTNNTLYGNNWGIGFDIEGKILTSAQFSESFYQRVMVAYFATHFEELSFLTENAKGLWEDNLEDDLGMGYDITSYKNHTKYSFALINRLALLAGLNFNGNQFIAIRGTNTQNIEAGPEYSDLGRLGRLLHAAAIAVPLNLQSGIPSKRSDLHGWWENWESDKNVMKDSRFNSDVYGQNLISLEQAYQRSKCVIVRKNPNISLVEDLIS